MYPGDTGASVSGGSTVPNTPQENIKPIHELPQNQDARGWPGYGPDKSCIGSRNNSTTSKGQNNWTSHQPKKLGIPGAWIDVDQDNEEWVSTGNPDGADTWYYDGYQDDSNGWKDDKNASSNGNNDCSDSSRSGWQNDKSIRSNKDNDDGWNINDDSGGQNDNGNSLKNNKNDDSRKVNNDPKQRDIGNHNSMPQKDWTREGSVANFANANSGNTASVNNQTWDMQNSSLQSSHTANDISNTFQRSPAHGHKLGGHNNPTHAPQAAGANQMALDPNESDQLPAESRDQFNILKQPQGTQENPGLRGIAGNTLSPLEPTSKPLDSTPNPYWGQRKLSHQHQSSRGRGCDHHSPRVGLVPTVPQEARPQRQLSHQVQSGKPLLYTHKVASPNYMDTHELPYAVFVFHYRSKGMYLPLSFHLVRTC